MVELSARARRIPPFPSPATDDPWLLVGAFGGTGVKAKAANPGLARTFVDILSQPEVMAGYSAQGTGSPSTVAGGPPPATIGDHLDTGWPVTFVDRNRPKPDVRQAMYDVTQAIRVGRGSRTDILTAVQSTW